jgi:hypothetical protein
LLLNNCLWGCYMSWIIVVYENVTWPWESLLLINCLWECYMRIFVVEWLFMRMLNGNVNFCCWIIDCCLNNTWGSLSNDCLSWWNSLSLVVQVLLFVGGLTRDSHGCVLQVFTCYSGAVLCYVRTTCMSIDLRFVC